MSKGGNAPDEETLKYLADQDQGSFPQMIAEEYNDAKLRAMNEANYIEDWQKDKHGRDINYIENEE